MGKYNPRAGAIPHSGLELPFVVETPKGLHRWHFTPVSNMPQNAARARELSRLFLDWSERRHGGDPLPAAMTLMAIIRDVPKSGGEKEWSALYFLEIILRRAWAGRGGEGIQ